jgi:hypothetical protein
MIAIALLPVVKLVVTYFNVSDILPSGNIIIGLKGLNSDIEQLWRARV